MMTIEEGLAAFLKANTGIAALVGDRVYLNKLPQTVTPPALTFRRVDGPRVNTHDVSGSAGTAHPRFQFDAWGVTSASCKAVTDAVRSALQGYHGAMGTGATAVTVQGALLQNEQPDDFSDAGLMRYYSDYIIWHEES